MVLVVYQYHINLQCHPHRQRYHWGTEADSVL